MTDLDYFANTTAAAAIAAIIPSGGEFTHEESIDVVANADRPQSALLVVFGAAAIDAAGVQFSITAKIQDSADGLTWADVVDFGEIMQWELGADPISDKECKTYRLNLASLRRHVRPVVTAECSGAADNNFGVVSCVVLLDGKAA